MLDFVHSTLRNRLDPVIREKLLYIYMNIRSLRNDRVRVIGNETFYTTPSGKFKVICAADEAIKDALLDD